MKIRVTVMLLATAAGVGAGTAVQAQGRNAGAEAIAVCESQRAAFVQMRARNREVITGRVMTGVLAGGLAGGLLGAAATQNQSSTAQRNTMVAGAVIGAIAGGVDQYLDAKRQITQDNRELSRLIDTDARGAASRIDGLITAINATGACRQLQIATWEQRLIATRTEYTRRDAARAANLGAAADDRARRTVERANRTEAAADAKILSQMDTEQGHIRAAINDDKTLFNDVLKYFDADISAMAEAQARVEGTSTASLRGSAEAYTVEVIPPALLAGGGGMGSSSSAFGSSGSAFGGGSSSFAAVQPAAALMPPPPPAPVAPPVYVQSNTNLRAKPNAQAALVTTLQAGAAVQNLGPSEDVPGWIQVEADGKTGYLQAARIGLVPPAGAKRAAAAPKTPAKAPEPPPPPPPVWQAQVRKPSSAASGNGHQAALVAQRNASAQADAVSQTGLARLQYAVQQGKAAGGR